MRINHPLPDFILQQLWGLSYFYHCQEAGGQGHAGTPLLGGIAVEVSGGKSWQLSFCLKVQSKGPDLEQSHIRSSFSVQPAPEAYTGETDVSQRE